MLKFKVECTFFPQLKPFTIPSGDWATTDVTQNDVELSRYGYLTFTLHATLYETFNQVLRNLRQV